MVLIVNSSFTGIWVSVICLSIIFKPFIAYLQSCNRDLKKIHSFNCRIQQPSPDFGAPYSRGRANKSIFYKTVKLFISGKRELL